MKWMRFSVRTTPAAEDLVVDAMTEIGLWGAQIEDHVPLSATEKEQMFVDILPDAEEDDGTSRVSFFAEVIAPGTVRTEAAPWEEEAPTYSAEELLRRMEERLAPWREDEQQKEFFGDLTVTVEETEDLDWINNWKQFFHQFRVDDILVIPSWEEPEEADDEPAVTLRIDPGTAFGTGMHETTQLCIRAMREGLTDKTKLLDIGTGSGILGILALKLGAANVVGTDLDPQALPAVIDNLWRNGLLNERPDEAQVQAALSSITADRAGAGNAAAFSGGSGQALKEAEDEVIVFDFDRFHLYLGNLIDDEALQIEVGENEYDTVIANILPDVLVPLTPAAVRALKRGGRFITSGILAGREDEVARAMEQEGLTVVSVTEQGEWRCVIGEKKD